MAALESINSLGVKRPKLPFVFRPKPEDPKSDEVTRLRKAAQSYGAKLYLADLPPIAEISDMALLRRFFSKGCLPLAGAGAVTPIVTQSAHLYHAYREELEAAFGKTAMALAPAALIEKAFFSRYRTALAAKAEKMVPQSESARGWNTAATQFYTLIALLGLAIALTLYPVEAFVFLLVAAMLCHICLMGFKLTTALAALRLERNPSSPPHILQWPKITIIAALYKEDRISEKLIKRLKQIDYPKDQLEVLLVIEEDDLLTRPALEAQYLPVGFRMICVPRGRIKTKPRALNYALSEASGAFIGIYDAEDAPEKDQLRKVVAHFYRCGPEVACIQGRLDYYNPYTNWISRCFTMEYGAWFRLLLPGVAALDLAVPLGGTTLFFRRDVLVKLGGWDAHNVTEDADLGIRLYRHSYRTQMLDSTTFEEANCRLLPWVKQRSRWIKGYLVTWIVHMRHPMHLLRQLGSKRFFALQIQLLLPSLQVLLAPLLWSFVPISFGVSHPLAPLIPQQLIFGAIGLFLLSAALDITTTIIALRRGVHKIPLYWVFAPFLYFPLATLAGYKALCELCLRPYYWDKTSHGIFEASASSIPPRPPEGASQKLRSNAF